MRRKWTWMFMLAGCSGGWGEDPPPYDVEMEIPRTEAFPTSLSDVGVYAEPAGDLTPAEGVFVVELSSELYTDHAHKQRLIRVPPGSAAAWGEDDRLLFPEGTVLAKTFFYPEDLRQETSARRIVETRLLVKTAGAWNVATYLWNEEQTDATLLLEGATVDLGWVDETGQPQEIAYVVPHEGACVTCHQADGVVQYLGPTVRNLHRPVTRDGLVVGQLDHLVARGVLAEGMQDGAASMVDYKNEEVALEARARAYLDMNCSHCHRPEGWDEAASASLDLRWEVALEATGLVDKADAVARELNAGRMPYLGVTVPHDDGIDLVTAYLGSW